MQSRLSEEVKKYRNAQYEIDPLFLNRWSPRSFQAKEIPEDTLFSLFEAARWAPSGGNVQPWRYLLARDRETLEKFYAFIDEDNVKWCKHAPVLALVLSKKTRKNGKPNPTHAFDTGTSWGYLALEAARKGIATHGMGGFDAEKAREILKIPDDFEPHAVIALGYRDEKDKLPEDKKKDEYPSNRKSVDEFVFDASQWKGE